jgi:mono/diheme cytochrome c family protein
MRISKNLTVIMVIPLLALSISSCGRDKFKEPMVLGGVTIPAGVLNKGRDNYTVYCRACHGINGDGNGPAAKGLRPAPRDFRLGLIKYISVSADYLPPDSDFLRIVKNGLHGTAMLEWDISDERLYTIVQYIKTFSDRWQDEYEEVGVPIAPSKDPFIGREEEGIKLGKMIYHGIASCWSCHPAYADKAYIYNANMELLGKEVTEFRPNLYEPELKDSDYGFKILPLDFLYHEIRAGTTKNDLFRTIAAGITGTAMPTWYGSIPDEQIWAMVYYVRYLSSLRDTAEGRRLKADLESQPEFTPPGNGF